MGLFSDTDDRRAVAMTAAAIFAGAAVIGLVEGLAPGGQDFTLAPAIVSLVLAVVVATVGPRAPRRALLVLGPLGIGLIGVALATTPGYIDSAIFYTWPILWMAFWYRRAGLILSVVSISVVHALSLLAMPDAQANLDRWIDVVAATLVVGVVVHHLRAHIERLVAELQDEARIDPLTGLLNRRGFEQRIAPMIEAPGQVVTVVMFDIDHFKHVNDTYGHEAGDRVLRWIGLVLREQSRGVDVVARMGGEEFVVLLTRTDVPSAERFAERVRAALASGRGEAHLRAGLPGDLALTASAGIASAPAPLDVDELITAADAALYAAKRAGRDRIRVAA